MSISDNADSIQQHEFDPFALPVEKRKSGRKSPDSKSKYKQRSEKKSKITPNSKPKKEYKDHKNHKLISGAAGILILGVAIGGSIGYSIGSNNASIMAATGTTTIDNDALIATGLESIPGFTGKQILDAPTTENVLHDYDEVSKAVSEALSKELGLTFEEPSEASVVPITMNGENDPITFQINSPLYIAVNQVLNEEQRRKAIDVVNSVVSTHGYVPFTIPESVTDKFFLITGQSNSSSTKRYMISITGSPEFGGETDLIQEPSVSVSFSSYPHLKDGTQQEFRDRIVKEFTANQGTKEFILISPSPIVEESVRLK